MIAGTPMVGAATLIALWSPYTTLAIIRALALFIRKQSPALARQAGCVLVRKRGDRRRGLWFGRNDFGSRPGRR